MAWPYARLVSEPLSQDEARSECERLKHEHPDRATHQFLPRRVDGGWGVVKFGLTPPLDNLSGEVRADERPEVGEDPRSSQMRNLGPSHG